MIASIQMFEIEIDSLILTSSSEPPRTSNQTPDIFHNTHWVLILYIANPIPIPRKEPFEFARLSIIWCCLRMLTREYFASFW